MPAKISMIAAVDRNWAIGGDNKLLWHIPEDLKRFKRVTMGKPIIMGRKTFESIGRPLPGRENVVITRNPDWSHQGVTVVSSLKAAYDHLTSADELMIIGGGEIYRLALADTDTLYLTQVDLAVDHADTWFPEVDLSHWQVISREDLPTNGEIPAYAFIDYARIK